MIEGKKITLTIEGHPIEGEIVRLLPNYIEVRITEPPSDGSNCLHVPHFMMGYEKHHYQDKEGRITSHGMERAEQLLTEIYLAHKE